MANDFNLIKQLREKTGAGFQDCQKALEEVGADLAKAVEILRKKGQKVAMAKSERSTKAGIIGVYLHSNTRVAAMVEVCCETDFVARNSEFQELAHDLAMQVVALNPLYLEPKDISTNILEKEKEIYRAELKKAVPAARLLARQGRQEKKPEKVLEKIVEGKLEKFYATVCLTKQPFIKDQKINIEDLVKSKIAKLGENIQIRKFIRLEI